MKIGLIGNGRMGADIFWDFVEHETSLVLICRAEEVAEKFRTKLKKYLSRKVRMGVLRQEQVEDKLKRICVSTDYAALDGCNLVIESVIEDIEVKQQVFERVTKIVDEECILASNTSSFNASEVFKNISHKERCIGIHFFFPVKLINIVEISCTATSESGYVNSADYILRGLGKEPMILPEKGNLILSRMISTIVCYAYMFYKEGHMTCAEIDAIFKGYIMMFGAFEMIDSTGFLIISNCLRNLTSERYEGIHKPLLKRIEELQALGYEGNNDRKGFCQYEVDQCLEVTDSLEEEQKKAYIERYVEQVKAVIINEIAYMYNNGLVTTTQFPEVVYRTLGLCNNPREWFASMGERHITEILNDLYKNTKISVFKVEDYKIYSE